jgi:S1-C subfamily serine protease
MSRQLRRALLIGLLTLGWASPVAAQALPDPFIGTIERLKRSVAPVACTEHVSGGPQRRLTRTVGTAFLLTVDGEFLTAAHVIAEISRSAGDLGDCPPVIYLPKGGWPSSAGEFSARWFTFDHRRCALDSTLDLALCRTRESPATDLGETLSAVAFTSDQQPDGMEVAFTGFPLSVVRPMSARGHIAMYSARSEMIIDQSGWPGGSGSPVYLVDGTVIGMVIQRGTGEGTGRTIVRTTSAIEDFLKRARSAK